MKQFYTYMWLREDGTPYYVGKGSQLRRTYSGRHSVNPPARTRIIVKEFECENDALFAEMFLVSLYGRLDNGTGILHNHTNGGEGQSGRKQSAETIEKRISKTRGMKRTEAQKKKFREGKLGDSNPSHKYAGETHWNRGLSRSEETRAKIRSARALQDMSQRKRTVCKRGHLRTAGNVTSNSTCKECKKLLRVRA